MRHQQELSMVCAGSDIEPGRRPVRTRRREDGHQLRQRQARPSRHTITAGLFVGPSILTLVLITGVPIIFLIAISLFDYHLGNPLSSARFILFHHYASMVGADRRAFWTSIRITIEIAAASTVLTVVLGLLLAVLLNQKIRGRVIFSVIFLLPMVVAPAIVGNMWRLMFSNLYGILNAILGTVGVAPNWLGSATLAPIAVVIVEVWEWTPFAALILYAGLQGVPQAPLEAAKMDGAGSVRTFWSVTLPILKPILFLVVLIRLIDTIKLFDIVYVLTGGGPGSATQTLGLRIFTLSMYTEDNLGQAAAVSVILVTLIALFAAVVITFLRRTEGHAR